MNGNDLRKLAVMLYNITPSQFAHVYGYTQESAYVLQKYREMTVDMGKWLGSLSHVSLDNLAEMVNQYKSRRTTS